MLLTTSHILTEYFLVDHASTEFTELAEYLTRSHGATHSIKYDVSTDSNNATGKTTELTVCDQLRNIFRVERHGENERYEKSPYANIPNS